MHAGRIVGIFGRRAGGNVAMRINEVVEVVGIRTGDAVAINYLVKVRVGIAGICAGIVEGLEFFAYRNGVVEFRIATRSGEIRGGGVVEIVEISFWLRC